MKLKAKQDFDWAHRGVQVESFKKGQVIDTEDADLIEVSTREKWAAKQGVAQDASTNETKVAETVALTVSDTPPVTPV